MNGAKIFGGITTTNCDLLDSEMDIVQITEMDACEPCETEQCDANVFPVEYLSQVSKSVQSERSGTWPRLSAAAASRDELKVYTECLGIATHNALGPRIPVNTSNNIEAWRELATDPNDAWLVDCIQFGFPMQYRGPPLRNALTPNHPSATCHQDHVDKYIATELSLGGLIGPFSEPPFIEWCNIAPLMTREKANKSERRIIVDLSFPPSNGPNHYIAKNTVFGKLLPHCLPSVNDAVNIITVMEFDVLLASIDISRAYRNFALDPLDWPLTCIQHDGLFYIDSRMPFGSRISSLYMQKMACLLQRTLLGTGITTVVYLDDVLVISPRNSDPNRQFANVIHLIRKVGLPVAWDKVISPTRCIRFLGIIIDLDEREIRIPTDKIDNFLTFIKDVVNRKFIVRRTLQKILGHINHISKGVPPARLFINRLLQCLREATNDTIKVDARLVRDLNWFIKFLAEFNGRSLIIDPAPSITIEADSCLTGGGARMCRQCYATSYPDSVCQAMHITQLEAYNCLIAARVFLIDHSNVCALIICDNKGAVSSLSSGRARDPILATIARAFWFFAAKRNIKFKFQHAPGESMSVADALSRRHLSDADAQRARDVVCDNNLYFVEVNGTHCDYHSYL